MSKNLLSTIGHLEVIASIKSTKTRNRVLNDFADNLKVYEAIREIAVNTIKRRVPLTETQKKKLRRYKKVLLSLAKTKNSKITKKKLVRQSGGFLPLLIPIVSGLISALK